MMTFLCGSRPESSLFRNGCGQGTGSSGGRRCRRGALSSTPRPSLKPNPGSGSMLDGEEGAISASFRGIAAGSAVTPSRCSRGRASGNPCKCRAAQRHGLAAVDEDRSGRLLAGARQRNPDIGVLRLARSVHDAAHDRDVERSRRPDRPASTPAWRSRSSSGCRARAPGTPSRWCARSRGRRRRAARRCESPSSGGAPARSSPRGCGRRPAPASASSGWCRRSPPAAGCRSRRRRRRCPFEPMPASVRPRWMA